MPTSLQHVTHVIVHRSVSPVDHYSFYGYNCLVEVEFQFGLQTICQKAFEWCTSLRRIAVPSTVIIIEAYAFAGCISLVRIQLSDGLKYIGEGVFYHCKALRILYIPSTVETIGAGCISRCTSLTNLQLHEGLKTVKMGALLLCKAMERLSIPSTVQNIGKNTFSDCCSLLEIHFAEGLQKIEAYAFAKCSMLCAIGFPYSVTRIGEKAFEDCASLMGVEFPTHGQLSLGGYVFKGCTALVNIDVSSSIDGLQENTFQGCALLEQNHGRHDTLAVCDRFKYLPIHQACYYAKSTRLHTVLAAIQSTDSEVIDVDAYGMTPFHVIATSATSRADLLGALLDKYSSSTISQNDNHGKTMLDYLVRNSCSNTTTMIKMVLERIFEAKMAGWGLPHWKPIMLAEIESKCWDGDTESKIGYVQELQERLFVFRQLEMTSLLEQAVWKMKMAHSQGNIDREFCRCTCMSDAVIGVVQGFL